jgi:hypothetical protein
MAEQIRERFSLEKVAIEQTSKVARLSIIIKGDPNDTTEKLKYIYEVLTGNKELPVLE